MTLKEAREIAEKLQILKNKLIGVADPNLTEISIAVLVFDNRITKLEECLRDLKYGVIKESTGLNLHSIHVNKAIEKARKLLEAV